MSEQNEGGASNSNNSGANDTKKNNSESVTGLGNYLNYLTATLIVTALISFCVVIYLQSNPGSGTKGAEYFLTFVSVLLSAMAGTSISYKQIRNSLREEQEKLLSESAALAASELNSFFINIITLSKTWNTIVVRYDVDVATKKSVNDTLENMKDVVQNSINKIISIGKGSKNPFGLYAYSEDFICPNLECRTSITALSLPAYPGGRSLERCTACGVNLSVQRSYDGLVKPVVYIGGQPTFGYTNDDASFKVGGVNFESQAKKSEEFECKNNECSAIVKYQAPAHFNYIKKGCPECGSVYKHEFSTRNLSDLPEIKSGEVDILATDTKIPCFNCHKELPRQFTAKNAADETYIGCHTCGAITYPVIANNVT